jgi:hypothetical protein
LKFQGGNFRVLIPELTTDLSGVVVPEDLVQIQSYLRWERSGKQDYTIEQQKVCIIFLNHQAINLAVNLDFFEPSSYKPSMEQQKVYIKNKTLFVCRRSMRKLEGSCKRR